MNSREHNYLCLLKEVFYEAWLPLEAKGLFASIISFIDTYGEMCLKDLSRANAITVKRAENILQSLIIGEYVKLDGENILLGKRMDTMKDLAFPSGVKRKRIK